MRFTLPGWSREPILWIGGILAGLNAVYVAITADLVDITVLYQSLGILVAAFAGRTRVSPIIRS